MRNVILVSAVFFIGLVLGASGCQGAACKGFCELDCKRIVTCADGKNPTGAAYDACVNACVDAARSGGAQTDEDCECCSGGSTLPDGGTTSCPAGSRSCDTEPTNVWLKTYSC